MSKRFVVVAAAALIATPAFAAEASIQDDGSPSVEQHALQVAALGGITPEGPILSGVEGADGSGGANILLDAVYGGLAGAIVGLGVALIEGGNYGRDIAIGAGAGVLLGAVIGAANVFGDTRGPYPARDGLGSTVRDPVIQAHTVALGGRF